MEREQGGPSTRNFGVRGPGALLSVHRELALSLDRPDAAGLGCTARKPLGMPLCGAFN